MARPLRIEYEGALYHVTARGNERRKIYFNKRDYEKFKKIIADAEEKYGILLHCYVLMGNHYHLIIETPEANLSKAMHHINGSYTSYINIRRKRSGHLFQGRYKAIVIDKDSYLLELSRYMHLNPVRAGMVEKPEAYSHSSYKSYISIDKEEIVTQELVWAMLSKEKGEASRRYQRFVESAIGEEQESPLKKVYGGMILGREAFIKEVLKDLKEEQLQKKDVSHRKALKSIFYIEDILDALSVFFKESKEKILSAKSGELRKIAIYALKRHTGASNRQIGECFRGRRIFV